MLLPWLDASMHKQTVGFAFQAVAAAHAIWSPSPEAPQPLAAPMKTEDALLTLAAKSDDAHDIKLGEAARREQHPEVLTALERWLA